MRLYPGRWFFGMSLTLIAAGWSARADDAEKPASVIAVQVKGTVEVQHGDATATEPVTDGAQLAKDDTVTTAPQSSVMLVLPNGSVVSLKEKSRLKISVAMHSPAVSDALAASSTSDAKAETPETGTSKTSFELQFGQMLTRVRKLNPTSTFEVQTPVSVAAVRGTIFEVSYQPDVAGEAQYNLSTSSGLVQVTPHGGQLVEVPADEQVDLSAEVGQHGVKIKKLKKAKLDRQKRDRIEKEGRDNDHNAGDLVKRAQQARAKAAEARDGAANRLAKPTPTPTKPRVTPKVPAVKRPPRR
ncbi:MAG TPA: FecR family protein [Lacunisphaera sp.]|nr:FecR family protein [Lacunisphaera sp.]